MNLPITSSPWPTTTNDVGANGTSASAITPPSPRTGIDGTTRAGAASSASDPTTPMAAPNS
ncbi:MULTISPECIES: hypothetical protein [unclassified Streptomyces]|uniref:hypothetical protein n=1 Tax=unclassified Streptomyces TaxID=2593676 RepID=UPI00403D4825